jgi:hypothetical protein
MLHPKDGEFDHSWRTVVLNTVYLVAEKSTGDEKSVLRQIVYKPLSALHEGAFFIICAMQPRNNVENSK